MVLHRPIMGGNNRAGALRSNSHELKSLDVPFGTVTLDSTGSVTALNLIRAGSSYFNRIGRKIEMQSIRLVAEVLPLRTIAAQDYIRILIIYDRQTNGALPAITDILQTTDQAGANSTTSFSGLNLNNRDRFVVLRDHHVTLPSMTDTAGVITNLGLEDPISRTFNFDDYVKLRGMLVQYKADSAPAVIGDIATGSLLLVTLGAQAAGTAGFQLNVETRLRYKDL